MKLTCDRADLKTAFHTVAAIVPSKTAKPVLGNIKLVCVGGSEVELIGSDGEIAIRHRLEEPNVMDPGEVLLPKAKTQEILNESQGESVTILTDRDKILITGDRSEFRLGSEDASTYPTVNEFDADAYHIIQAGQLRRMIQRTLFACDVTSTRYALGGIRVDLKKDTILFAATDTRRLAVITGSVAKQGLVETKNAAPVIPARAMQLVERSLPAGDEPVWMTIDNNSAMFKTSRTTIFSRLVEGRFPRYEDVIPKSSKKGVELVTGPFHAAVRQALIVTTEESRGVVFHFTSGQLTLRSHAEFGESTVELPVAYDGDDFKIEFDPRYVADFLKVLDSESQVLLRLNDPESAALFQTQDGYQYVVMPLARDK